MLLRQGTITKRTKNVGHITQLADAVGGETLNLQIYYLSQAYKMLRKNSNYTREGGLGRFKGSWQCDS